MEEISREDWMEQLKSLHITRVDMNKLIMNYLVTEGFKEAAEKFSGECGLQPGLDLELLNDRIRIREAINEGKVHDAITLVNRLHPELLDSNRLLYFHLQQLYLIELIRAGTIEDALCFAQTHLAHLVQEMPDVLPELERTMTLLAFDRPEKSTFGDLLQPSQRQKVASELNMAILESENQESTPKLANVLKLLLWTQGELDARKVKYPKMTDIARGTVDVSK